MSLNRKRKKELRRLQVQANNLWESQQVLVGEAANVAREATRQLGHLNREYVIPGVQASYGKYAAPYVDKSKQFSKQVLSDKVVPTAELVSRLKREYAAAKAAIANWLIVWNWT